MSEQLHETMSILGGKIPTPLDRNLYMYEAFSEKSCAQLNQKIIEINNHDRLLKKMYSFYDLDYKPKPIKLYIDSPGGFVYPAFGTISLVDLSITPVHTIVVGLAASAAFLLAIHGHKRFAYKHATLMYHQPSAGAFGMSKDMEEKVEEVARVRRIGEEMIIKETKIGIAKLKDNYEKKKDWYMSASEALKWGCIDEIIE